MSGQATAIPCYGAWHRTQEHSWFRFLARGDHGAFLYRLGPAPFWEAGVQLESRDPEPFRCDACAGAFPTAEARASADADRGSPPDHPAGARALTSVEFELVAVHEAAQGGVRGRADLGTVGPEAEAFRRVHAEWVGSPSQAFVFQEEEDTRIYGVWGPNGRARLEESAEPLGEGRWRTTYRIVQLTPDIAALLP